MGSQKRKMQQYLRAAIQIYFFIFFSHTFTAAFGGVKYIASQVGAGEQSLGRFFHAPCGGSSAERIYPWSHIADPDPGGYVCARTFFLSFSLSHGSCFLSAAGPAVFFTAQGQRSLPC